MAVVNDYLDQRRPDVTDGYGRDPLLATQHGRVADSTIRTSVYDWSRPCVTTGECPHGRGVPDCDAAQDVDTAPGCPSSVTPHPIRRGYITHLLQTGVPVQVVSNRCNVFPEIIDQHDVPPRGAVEPLQVRKRRLVVDETGRVKITI